MAALAAAASTAAPTVALAKTTSVATSKSVKLNLSAFQVRLNE